MNTSTREKPEYTDCSNCGGCNHAGYKCPCACHDTKPRAARNVCRRVRLSPYRRGMGPTFTLTMWDGLFSNDPYGKSRVGYELAKHENGKRTVIFRAEDFYTPGCTDSDDAVEGLLGFLTLRPGDTDAEYFENYTDEQRAFASAHAEALSMESMDRFGKAVR